MRRVAGGKAFWARIVRTRQAIPGDVLHELERLRQVKHQTASDCPGELTSPPYPVLAAYAALALSCPVWSILIFMVAAMQHAEWGAVIAKLCQTERFLDRPSKDKG